MSYVPGFEHDLFISYSWVDDDTASPTEKGWVTRFDDELRLRLKQRVSKHIDVWRDRSIDGSHVFNKVVESTITNTAVFLSITTPNCLRESPYCEQERMGFFAKAQKEDFGLTVASRFRIYNVLLYNILPAEWPAEYGKDRDASSGFQFYKLDPDLEPDDLGKPLDPDSEAFDKSMDRLVGSLRGILVAMNLERSTAPEQKPAMPDTGDKNGFTIFLADTSETLSKTRKNILMQLDEHKIRVLLKIPPPYESSAHEQAVQQHMKEADLCVHLLTESPGREIDDAPDDYYIIEQVELGLELAAAQLIWMPQSFDLKAVDDEEYRKLVQRLHEERPAEKDIEICKSLPTEILRLILDKKAKIDLLRQQSSQATRDLGVLMDCHVVDEATTYELANLLNEQGLDHKIVMDTEQEPEQKHKYYEGQLRKAAVLIILFGSVGVDWVVERIRTVQKMVASNSHRIQCCSIYLPVQKSANELNPIIKYIQQPALKLQQMSLQLVDKPEQLLTIVQQSRGGS